MTEKRFYKQKSTIEDYMIYDEDKEDAYFISCKDESNADYLVVLLNDLNDENNELKSELKIYRKVANCRNCDYHDYDCREDGDDFEICKKGNDVTEGICEDWREL